MSTFFKVRWCALIVPLLLVGLTAAALLFYCCRMSSSERDKGRCDFGSVHDGRWIKYFVYDVHKGITYYQWECREKIEGEHKSVTVRETGSGNTPRHEGQMDKKQLDELWEQMDALGVFTANTPGQAASERFRAKTNEFYAVLTVWDGNRAYTTESAISDSSSNVSAKIWKMIKAVSMKDRTSEKMPE